MPWIVLRLAATAAGIAGDVDFRIERPEYDKTSPF